MPRYRTEEGMHGHSPYYVRQALTCIWPWQGKPVFACVIQYMNTTSCQLHLQVCCLFLPQGTDVLLLLLCTTVPPTHQVPAVPAAHPREPAAGSRQA